MLAKLVTFGKFLLGTTILAAAASVFGPVAYEAVHNENQQDTIEASIQEIVRKKFFTCNDTAAGQYQNDRAAQLTTIMTKAAGENLTSWKHPFDLYLSGVKRISNTMPGAVRLLEKAVGDIPDDYHSGKYQTPLDSSRRNLEDIVKIGIGTCFDSELGSLKMGSLFMRDKGMIILNPALPEKALVTHMSRHLQRLDQDIVKPHDRLVTNANEDRSDYDVVTAQLSAYVELRKNGASLALDAEGDANTVDFKELDKRLYKFNLMVKQPEVATQPAPTDQPKAPAKKITVRKP